MRRLLAPLSRWLDRRIDARIASETAILRENVEVARADLAARERYEAAACHLLDIFAGIRTTEKRPTFASAVSSAVGARSPHEETPARHGRSLERIHLNGTATTSGLLDDLPPVGSSFVQVIATQDGMVLLGSGAPLPDNHVRYGAVTRMSAPDARAIAAALVRAADRVKA